MPEVRELVNVISFRPDKASIASTRKTLSGLASTALKVGAAALTAGAVMQRKMEKNIATARFYGVELKEINKIINEQQGEVFSRMEIAGAVAEMSDLAITSDQLSESLKFLKVSSLAMGEMNLSKMTAEFDDFIKTGSSESLLKIGAVSKELAEVLGKTTFTEGMSKASQKKRADEMIKLLQDQMPRLRKLAEEQRETLNFATDELVTSTSNLGLRLGETTKPAMVTILQLATQVVNKINQMDGLWKSIEKGAKLIESIRETTFGEWMGGDITLKEATERQLDRRAGDVATPEIAEFYKKRVQKRKPIDFKSVGRSIIEAPKKLDPILKAVGLPDSKQEGEMIEKVVTVFMEAIRGMMNSPEVTQPIQPQKIDNNQSSKPIQAQQITQPIQPQKIDNNQSSKPIQPQKIDNNQSSKPIQPQKIEPIKIDVSGDIKINGNVASPELLKSLAKYVDNTLSYRVNRLGQSAGSKTSDFIPQPILTVP